LVSVSFIRFINNKVLAASLFLLIFRI